MSDNSFDAAQKALRHRAVVDLEEPLPDEQPARWWLRIVVVLVFFTFGAIVWLSWQDNAGDGTPVLVAAPATPIKERPEDPGGIEPRNKDTEIPGAISEMPSVETLPPVVGPLPTSKPPERPEEEEIIPPMEAASDDPIPSASTTMAEPSSPPATDPSVPLGDIQPSAGSTPADVPVIPVEEAPAKPAPAPPAPPTTMASNPSAPEELVTGPAAPLAGAVEAPVPPAATPPAVATPAPTPIFPNEPSTPPVEPMTAALPDPIAPAPEPVEDEPDEPEVAAVAPRAEPAPAPRQTASGVRVQVASLRSEEAARTAWDRVVQRNRDVLGGMDPVIVEADVKGATYYRAQATGFASRAEAQAACTKMKSRGTDCLVIGR